MFFFFFRHFERGFAIKIHIMFKYQFVLSFSTLLKIRKQTWADMLTICDSRDESLNKCWHCPFNHLDCVYRRVIYVENE